MHAIGHYVQHVCSSNTFGGLVILNLIAFTTNALNGELLAQRPEYDRST